MIAYCFTVLIEFTTTTTIIEVNQFLFFVIYGACVRTYALSPRKHLGVQAKNFE